MEHDRIIGWGALSEVSGINIAALQMRATRGKLPLTRQWVEGRRAFDPAEVARWLEAEADQKKQH